MPGRRRPRTTAGGKSRRPTISASWEAAWNDGGSPADTRVFLPALLDDDTVRIFAAERDGRIAAGCIANRSDDVVGISNFFTAARTPQPDLIAAVAAIADAFPVSTSSAMTTAPCSTP